VSPVCTPKHHTAIGVLQMPTKTLPVISSPAAQVFPKVPTSKHRRLCVAYAAYLQVFQPQTLTSYGLESVQEVLLRLRRTYDISEAEIKKVL
jgi:hypothetical protein